MFPLLQLQIATNILHAENNDQTVEIISKQNQIDPSTFDFENYSAVLPVELRNKEEYPHLKKIPIETSETENVIPNVPPDVKSIRIFSDSNSISPLLPGQLGIINEAHKTKRAYFMIPAAKSI